MKQGVDEIGEKLCSVYSFSKFAKKEPGQKFHPLHRCCLVNSIIYSESRFLAVVNEQRIHGTGLHSYPGFLKGIP